VVPDSAEDHAAVIYKGSEYRNIHVPKVGDQFNH